MIEEFFLYLFVVLLPIQRRIILFQSDWYFNEWRSGFLYGTDILVAVLLGLWLWRIRHSIVSRFRPTICQWWLAALVGVAGVSLSQALLPGLAWYRWIKLSEMALLFVSLSRFAWRRINRVRAAFALVVGGVLQAIIAIGQFLHQGDLGLRFAGESVLRTDLHGIAAMVVHGVKTIRAYGTTPHPNVLAAYLLLAILAWYGLSLVHPPRRFVWLWRIAYVVLVAGLFFTFSRTVWFFWFLCLAGIWVCAIRRSALRRPLASISILTILVLSFLAIVFWPHLTSRLTIAPGDEAITLRLSYAKTALESGEGGIRWFGVGIGNFVPWFMKHDPNLPLYIYQPVHNIYLLAYAETGILGSVALVGFLIALFAAYRRGAKEPSLGWLLCGFGMVSLLGIGLFDHFLWTLQEGQLMFWGTAALLTSY